MCMSVLLVLVYVHCAWKSVLDSLELELQIVVSYTMWMLETEPRSSGRATNAIYWMLKKIKRNMPYLAFYSFSISVYVRLLKGPKKS